MEERKFWGPQLIKQFIQIAKIKHGGTNPAAKTTEEWLPAN